MKITSVKLRVREYKKAEAFVDIELFIDGGAIYSVLPKKVLGDLKIEPYGEMDFPLADGSIIKRKIGTAFFELEGKKGLAPVVYGEEGDMSLLGSSTLESLGLMLNPFTRTLHPMHLFA